MRRRVAVYGLAVAKSGFTLTEILVAVTILAITVAAIYTSFKGGLTSWTKGTIRMERYQNARAALEMMSREISAAIIIAADGSYQIDFYGVDNTETVSGETVDDDYLCFVAPVREDPDEPDLRKVSQRALADWTFPPEPFGGFDVHFFQLLLAIERFHLLAKMGY